MGAAAVWRRGGAVEAEADEEAVPVPVLVVVAAAAAAAAATACIQINRVFTTNVRVAGLHPEANVLLHLSRTKNASRVDSSFAAATICSHVKPGNCAMMLCDGTGGGLATLDFMMRSISSSFCHPRVSPSDFGG